MAKSKHITRQNRSMDSEAAGLSIIFDSIRQTAIELGGDIAEGSGYLLTALQCMAEQGSARADALAEKLSAKPTN